MSRLVYCCRCAARFTISTTKNGKHTRNAGACRCGCPHWSVADRATVQGLVVKWSGLVPYVIDRYVIRTMAASQLAALGGRDELVSHGKLQLVEIANRFDPDRGFAFSTFATVSLRNRFWQFTVRRKKDAVHVEDLDGIPSDAIDPADHAAENEPRQRVVELLRGLGGNQREIIEGRFYRGETLQVISEKIGVTRERVRQIQNEALKELQYGMGEA